MEAESLVVQLEEFAACRPWALRSLYAFYFSLCALLNIDPGSFPNALPDFFKNLNFSSIFAFLDIVEYFKSVPISPGKCQTLEELDTFRENVPLRFAHVYEDEIERREAQLAGISDADIDDLMGSQYDSPIIKFAEQQEKDELLIDDLMQSQYDDPIVEYLGENYEEEQVQEEESQQDDQDDNYGNLNDQNQEESQEEDQFGGAQVLPPAFEQLPNCQILDQNIQHFPYFNMEGRQVKVQLNDDIETGFENLVGHITTELLPSDYIQISARSLALPHIADIEIPFRRCDQIDPSILFDQLSDELYDDQIMDFFLGPVLLTFNIVRLPAGYGRRAKQGLQTYEAFSKDCQGIKRITNNDHLCLPRALAVAIAFDKHESNKEDKDLFKKYDSISKVRPNNLVQKMAALELCQKAGVPTGRECGSANSFFKFRAYLKDYCVLAYRFENNYPVLLYGEIDSEDKRHKLVLINQETHYNVVTKLRPFFGKDFLCTKCMVGYNNKTSHKCDAYCYCCLRDKCCTGDSRECGKCFRKFTGDDCFNSHLLPIKGTPPVCLRVYHCKDCMKFINLNKRKQNHTCGETYCKVCKRYEPSSHLCYIQKIIDEKEQKNNEPGPAKKRRKDTPNAVIIFWDLETVQFKKHETKEAFVHQAVLCVSETVCEECESELPSDYRCVLCSQYGPRQNIFRGLDCLKQFLSYLRKLSKVKSVTLLAHNAKGFDNAILLREIINQDETLKPDVIANGTKLLQMRLFNLNFLDSLNFIPVPLSKFADTFGLNDEFLKGYFPHFLFNTIDHDFDVTKPWETNYVLEDTLPSIEAYGAENFTKKDHAAFLKWYKEQTENKTGFNYMKDLEIYCCQDVYIHKAGCLAFKRIIMDIADVDPFQSAVTIAGICSVVYRKKFMEKDTIGLIPTGGYRLRDKQSRIALEWLAWESHRRKIKIDSALNGKEPQILKMKVDGQDTNKVVYEFQGCYTHGCRTCFTMNRNKPLYSDPNETLNTRFDYTLKKVNRLKQLGYKVVEMWECSFNTHKKQNQELKDFLSNNKLKMQILDPLDPRDSFFGGRCSTLKTYHKTSGVEKIFFTDICSLYPFINKTGATPLGHGKPLLDNFPDISVLQGIVKCRVLPPRKLFHPVLPSRSHGKLMFTLCGTCSENRYQGLCEHTDEERQLIGTWVANELRGAVEHGYKVLEIFEAWQYQITKYNKQTRQGGLFSGYIDAFLKIKTEASGYPPGCETEQQREAFIKAFKEAEGIELDPTKIKFNPGLRAIAKLLLNSMWGKFAQRVNVAKTEIIKDPYKLYELLLDPEIEVRSVLTLNDHTLLVKWIPSKDSDVILPHTNVVVASYTTALARLELYRHLETVGSLALYSDTDSVVYLSPTGQPLIKTGSNLGDMTDELSGYGKNSYIDTWASAGCKNYTYYVTNPDTKKRDNVTKVKGFRINVTNEKFINGENLQALLGVGREDPMEPIKVPIPNQIARLPDFTVVSINKHKTYRSVIDKVRIMENNNTLPYGY